MTCPIPAMMNLCTFMPSSLTQVRQPSGLVLYLSNMLNCVCLIFLLDIGYLLLPSPCMFSISISPLSSFHLHVPAVSCHTVPVFFISITPLPSLFFCFSFFPPPSLPHLSCHSVTLFLPFIPFIHTFSPLTALYYTCNTSLLSTSCLSAAFFNPSPIFQFPILDVLPDRVADACLPGFWGAAGVCNDHGKTYALYAITVVRRNQDGSEDAWKTYRRYSDFHDFHMRITEQVCVGLNSITPLLHDLK